MDLSTLDTLLKSHVNQLTSLYSQLGAPGTTVPSKLEELHRALVGTVEQQRHEAEEEVKDVKMRIEGLEATITRKRAQLNGVSLPPSLPAPTSSTTTSETLLQQRDRLEKEEVALERDVQIREKQLAEIVSLIEGYTPVLGQDFIDEISSSSNGGQPTIINNKTDLSLERLAKLEKILSSCKDEITRREQVFQALLHEILELWTELGISPSSNGASTSTSASSSTTPSQTASELAFDLSILHTTQALSGASSSSSSSPPSTSSSASKHAHNLLKPDKTTLDQLSSRKESLENERETRMQHIQDLYDQLYPLWTKLGVSDEEADEFVEIWKGCEKRCIDAYNAELARMLQVKAENMAIFIHREREDIISLWDGLFYSDEQRAHFDLIDSDSYNEEVLLSHEIEKNRLLEEKASKDIILNKLAKYFSLLDEIRQLEESANDPSRLTGRGQRGDPGRLLREEKQRKRVAKEKPKLESDLLRAIPEWEEQYQQPFMVAGSRLLDDLSAKVESEQAARPPSRRAKTPAGPPPSAAKASSSTQTVKRTLAASSTSQASAPNTGLVKRARTNTMSSHAGSIQQRSMGPPVSGHHRNGMVPATPCPPQNTGSSHHRDDYMLVQSVGPSSSHGLEHSLARQTSTTSTGSRLPLKAAYATQASHVPSNWHSMGVNADKQGLGAHSLFSPPGQTIRPSHKTAFRPRPSVASVSTIASSVPSMSAFSSRSSRIPSTATTVSTGSMDSRC